MVTPNHITDQIRQRIAQAVSLGVARIATSGEVSGTKLNLSAEAADGFREHCRSALDTIEASNAVHYATGAELADAEFFLIDDPDTIDELAGIGDLRNSIETMPTIKPAELDLTIQLYVVAAGGDTQRVLFVRRANPQVSFSAGRFLAIGRERLARIDEPTFSFSSRFDFVMGDGWVVVLDQHSFEMLFRQVGLVEKNIERWIGGITKYLPMGDDDVERLREVAVKDSRTWRRLREIEQRGHLADVDLGQVRTYAAAVGLDPDTVVVDDRLTFDPAQRFSFLHLLNEDLYKGELTNELFESHRKTSAGGS